MSNPRPWQGAFRPWGPKAHDIYQTFVDENPDLAPLLLTLPRLTARRYWLQQLYKRMIEPMTWNTALAKARVQELELRAAV